MDTQSCQTLFSEWILWAPNNQFRLPLASRFQVFLWERIFRSLYLNQLFHFLVCFHFDNAWDLWELTDEVQRHIFTSLGSGMLWAFPSQLQSLSLSLWLCLSEGQVSWSALGMLQTNTSMSEVRAIKQCATQPGPHQTMGLSPVLAPYQKCFLFPRQLSYLEVFPHIYSSIHPTNI